MILSYPELRSDRLDDVRFVSTEDIHVDLLLCEPSHEFLSSGSKFVDQTKHSDRFSFEGDRKNCPRLPAQFMDSRIIAEVQPSAVPTLQCPRTNFSFETLASDGSYRSQLRDSCRGGNKGLDVLGDGFGDGVSAGFCEVVYQRGGVVGEGMEFDNREVSFSERPSLVEEDGRGILSVLDRLDGLVRTGGKSR